MNWIDFDNDGWLDLFLVNGHPDDMVDMRAVSVKYREPLLMFENTGRSFKNVSAQSGPVFAKDFPARGMTVGDYDNDGDLDVLVMNMNEPPSLLRNDYAGPNRSLSVRLEGRASNRLGLGATVLVTVGGRTTARAVLSQSSYYSHDDVRLHFGMGTAPEAERIEVRWPGGKTSVLERAAAGRMHQIVEP